MAVSLSPLGGAGWQFLDNNGNVLSGGKLYTYAAGSTTPLTTYSSSSGLVANANPIILDSAGRISGEVWLTSGSYYKVVLKDSTDVQIGSYDNLYGQLDVTPTAFGTSLITAANAAAGRTVMGSSTIGDAIFIATTAAAARSPLSLAGDWFKGLVSASRTTTGTFGTYASTQGAGLDASTGVYTVPTTGKYLFYAYYQLTPGATAGQYVDYGFISTGTVSNGGYARIVVPSASVSGVNMYMGVMWFIDLNAGNTVYAQSGVNASALTCSCQEFSGVRIN